MITLSALLLALPCALPQDQLITVSGRPITGKVTVESLTEVQYIDASGESRTIASSELLDIRLQVSSDTLKQGEAFLRLGDFQNAVSLFEQATQEEGPFWHERFASLRHAEALLSWANFDASRASEAQSVFQNWRSKWPSSYWSPRVRMGAAKARALTGETEPAAAELQALADEAFEQNLGARVSFPARLVRCQVYLTGKQPRVAESRLKDLVSSLDQELRSSETPSGLKAFLGDLADSARILLGEAILAKDGFSSAKTYWDALLRDEKAGNGAKAAAWIGLALEAKNRGEMREAQLLLARVIATLPAQDETSAHALFELGQVCRDLGDNPVPGRAYWERVIRDFPHTTWAVHARVSLGNS